MKLGRGTGLAGGALLLAMIAVVAAFPGSFDLAGKSATRPQTVQPTGGGPAAPGAANPVRRRIPAAPQTAPAAESAEPQTGQTEPPAEAVAQPAPQEPPPQSDRQTEVSDPGADGGQADANQNITQGQDNRTIDHEPNPPAPPMMELAPSLLEYLALFLQIVVAAALGAAAGYGLAWRKIRRIDQKLAKLDELLKKLGEGLLERDTKPEAGNAGASSPQEGGGARREAGLAAQAVLAPMGPPGASADRGRARQAPAQAPAGEPAHDAPLSPTTDSEEAWMMKAYRELLASGIPKRREIDAKFERFGNLVGLQMTDAGKILVGRYTGGDPSELLMALGNGGELMVVPSYEYLSSFGRAFKAASENPPLITQYFVLDVDGTGHPKLIQPARARLDEAGQIKLTRPGRLAGFVR